MLNNDLLYNKLKSSQTLLGAIPSPFDSSMVLRGLKTLALRMEQHQKNGMAVAKALSADPRVLKVFYPGLNTHPQHKLFKKQMKGFGGMVSLYLKANLEQTLNFMKSLKVDLWGEILEILKAFFRRLSIFLLLYYIQGL
jgi:cystathionine gamma-lyase